MRARVPGLLAGLACLLAAGCRTARLTAPTLAEASPSLASPSLASPSLGSPSVASPRAAPPSERASAARRGAAPGGEKGPGGFVPRGRARNFYAGAGGRLWYYLNNHYWVPQDLPLEDLWLRAEVRADFRALERWPKRAPLASPPTKTTVEYWAIGPGHRSLRLDNHKDYWLLDEKTCAGAIEVEVTLTLGRLRVKDERGRWGPPDEAYVLESRDYHSADEPGLGAERTRFEPLPDRPTTVWAYRVPWSTWPAPLTRSAWQELQVPTWTLRACRDAPAAPASGDASPAPVLTPGEGLPPPAPR